VVGYIYWIAAKAIADSTARSSNASQARGPETDNGFMAKAVIGQRFGEIRLPGLAGLEPLGLTPVDPGKVRVITEGIGQHPFNQVAKRHRWRQRKGKGSTEQQVVLPADIKQLGSMEIFDGVE